MSIDQDDVFVSFAALLLDLGLTAGQLATLVEKHGVWGWDRFDRFVQFKEGKPEYESALERLALQVQRGNDPFSDRLPDLDLSTDRLSFFGWLEQDWLAISGDLAEPIVVRRPSDIKRVENTLLSIIGVLMMALLGNLKCKRHPDFATEADVMSQIEDQYKNHSGLSRRNLIKYLPLARKAVMSSV